MNKLIYYWKQIHKPKSVKIQAQIYQHLLYSGLSWIIDSFALYLLVEFLHVNYMVSATLAYVLGLGFMYAFCVKLIFPSRKLQKINRERMLFLLGGLLGLVILIASMYLFTSILGIHYLISKVLATILVFTWNFVSRKIVLF